MRRLARLTAICAPIFLAATNAGAATPTAKVAAPDPLASMPGEISAILDVTTAPRILLMQDEHGTPFPRELKVGDVYRDGWRVVSVAGQSVTLKKGDQQRSVSPRAKPAAAPVMVASLPVQAPAAAPLTGAALGQPQNFGGGRGGRGGGGGFGGRGAGGPGGFGGRAGGRGQEGGFSGSNAALGAGGQARTFQGIPAGASAGAGGIADLAAIMNNPAAQAALANPATQAMIQQQLQQLGGQMTPEMMQQMMQQFGGGRNVTVGPNGAPAPPQRPQVLQGAPNFLGPPAVR